MTMKLRRQFGALPPDELNQLLAAGPNDATAFLPATANQRVIAETLVALANANGGVVLLGVTAKGVPQQARDLTALRERVIEATLLADPPLILPAPQLATTAEGQVVV